MATTATLITKVPANYVSPLPKPKGRYADITKVDFYLSSLNLTQVLDKTTAQFPPPFQAKMSNNIETLRVKENDRMQRVKQLYQPLKNDNQKRDVFSLCTSFIADINLFSTQISLIDRKGNAPFQELYREKLFQAECEIGKIIYASENFPKDTQAFIKQNQNNSQAVVETLEQKIIRQLKITRALLLKQESPEIEVPKKVAQLILTSEGRLNFGVIELIRGNFFASKFGERQAYEWRILQNLVKIDDAWRKQFEALDFPQNGISKLQYQQEILALFFNEKSSYTTLEECARAVFHVHQVKQNQFPEITVSLETPFLLGADGIVEEYGKQFCECPNLIEACKSMGIREEDIDAASCQVLSQLFGSSIESRMVTWKKILETYKEGDLQKAMIAFQLGQKNTLVQLEKKRPASPPLTRPNTTPSEKPRQYERISGSVPAFFQNVFKRLFVFG